MRHALTSRLKAHLQKSRLFREPGRVVLAVSGGADSLAMLDMMATLAPELGLELVVAHADHGIHAGSAAVASRVSSLASSLGLASRVSRLALRSHSETEARRARYDFLRSVQGESGARWLATAHHADDQAETVLHRVLKGSAPAGLAGIPARGPRGLVRPLLPFTRAELLAHVQAAGLVHFEDPANADPRHDRSWLRAAVLPLVTGRYGNSLLDVAAHARRESRAWDAVLDVLPGLDVRLENGGVSVARAALSGYDKVLAGRVLRAAARRAMLAFGPRQAERLVRFAADGASGRRMDVGQGVVAEVAFDRLVIAPLPTADCLLPLATSHGAAQFGAFSVAWRDDAAPAGIERQGWTTWVAAARRAESGLRIRSLEPGDRLAPLGGIGHRAVTKLLMEAKIARSARSAWPVLVQDDQPVWIPGVCRGSTLLPEPGAPATRIDVKAG